MNYISFTVHNKTVAIPIGKYLLEPTQINKIKKTKCQGLKVGEINLRGQNVNVLDVSKLIHKRNLKKFDGLLFVHTDKKDIAIKFEGFYKLKKDLDPKEVMINLDDILDN